MSHTYSKTQTYIVLYEIWMVPLNPIIQDGNHHIFPCISSLPGTHDIHVRLAVMDIIITVLQKPEREIRQRTNNLG